MYIHLQNRNKEKKHLCLECGLCCTGKLFKRMIITPEESKYFKKDKKTLFKSIELIATDNGRKAVHSYVKTQACENIQEDNKCSVYENRPQVCKDFKCGVLKSYENGEMHWNTALNIINGVKKIPWLSNDRRESLNIMNLKN